MNKQQPSLNYLVKIEKDEKFLNLDSDYLIAIDTAESNSDYVYEITWRYSYNKESKN